MATRIVSLAPRTRPEDLVPAMVARAPTLAVLRKSRRVVSGMVGFLSCERIRGVGAGRLLRYHLGGKRQKKNGRPAPARPARGCPSRLGRGQVWRIRSGRSPAFAGVRRTPPPRNAANANASPAPAPSRDTPHSRLRFT